MKPRLGKVGTGLSLDLGRNANVLDRNGLSFRAGDLDIHSARSESSLVLKEVVLLAGS